MSAFNLEQAIAESNGGNTKRDGQWERAVGFLNVSIPGANGGTVKIGTIPLKASVPTHVKILAWIEKHGADAVVPEIAGSITLDYNSAEKKEHELALDEKFG